MLSPLSVRIVRAAAILAIAMVSACERVPLLAPTESIITVTAPTSTLAPGGTTEVTAFVIEQAGTPVQNGTLVRFTATLGQVNPVEAETRGGIAVTTFTAGSAAGTARVRANSGGATGGDGDPPSNVVEIQIGGGAANVVTVNASPSRVPSTGGTVTVAASALDAAGNRLTGVPISFSTTAGTLSATSATTDSSGDATVSLTTNREARVTARVADKTAEVTVTVGVAPTVSLTHDPTTPTAGRSMTLTVTPSIPAGGQAPRVVVQWGDGTETDLGIVSAARTTTHTYAAAGTYTLTVTASADGEVSTASNRITVTQPSAIGVAVSASLTTPQRCAPVTFTAAVTPNTEVITSYDWSIQSNTASENESVRTTSSQLTRTFLTTGLKQIAVTATASDGRQTTGQTTINVQPNTTVTCPS